MAMWFINSYDIEGHRSPWSDWVAQNPEIQPQYDAIIERLTEQYKIHFGMTNPPAKCIIDEKGTFTDLSNNTYTGHLLTVTFGDKDTADRGLGRYMHALVVTMDGDMPTGVVEIQRDNIFQTAKIYQFPQRKK